MWMCIEYSPTKRVENASKRSFTRHEKMLKNSEFKCEYINTIPSRADNELEVSEQDIARGLTSNLPEMIERVQVMFP